MSSFAKRNEPKSLEDEEEVEPARDGVALHCLSKIYLQKSSRLLPPNHKPGVIGASATHKAR